MKKEWLVKTLALGVVVLFVSVSFQPVLAKDTISLVKKSDTNELLETLLDIANNPEIQNILQKYECRKNLLESQYLKVRLQKEIIDAIEKSDELNERIKQLQNLPCDCENENLTRWNFPEQCCFFLIILYIYLFLLVCAPFVYIIFEIIHMFFIN
jgi:hypothetical protein